MVGVSCCLGTVRSMMNREEAVAFVALHAQASVAPVLTEEEVRSCVDRSRIVDRAGYRINELGYTETIWGTRAVMLAFELKVAKAYTVTDFSADGTSISASQIVTNLKEQRALWRSKCIAGSI